MISTTHTSGQKPRGRQLNAKVCGSESAIFRNCSCYDHYVQQLYLANGLSTHRNFSTKLMLITAWSSTTTQRLHSFKLTLVNKSHSQHSEAAVRCSGHHFLILYACAHEVSFPDQRPRSLVWKRDKRNRQRAVCMAGTVFSSLVSRPHFSRPPEKRIW